VTATSRFYNTSAKNGGTYGMYVPALPESAVLASGQLGTFQHLTYTPGTTSGFRVNIGFANAVGVAVDLVIKLYGDGGELLGRARSGCGRSSTRRSPRSTRSSAPRRSRTDGRPSRC